MNLEKAWQQVVTRDPNATFFYAVRSTGVFCRPTCPSRRPQQKNIIFFPTSAEAKSAGFRACLRCQPENRNVEVEQVERLCQYLHKHVNRRVTLNELGRLAGASPFTVQRLFQRVLGTSAINYQRQLRTAEFKHHLQTIDPAQNGAVTEAIYRAGYGSSSRVYEDSRLGMSPGKYRAGGRGECIGYATADSELGQILIASTQRGICAVLLGTPEELTESLQSQFPEAKIARDSSLQPQIEQVLASCLENNTARELPLDIRGTAFQQRVWQALRQIPRGKTLSYMEVAKQIGSPKAIRAVANACAQNRLALLVPCHRVIGNNGKLAGYRWGLERKRKLLTLEKAATHEGK
jgi:AraC family transcriptional regulator, regulatory protein of adaptative response / methylated-DNA-[protein]-cysteine methyltransferase